MGNEFSEENNIVDNVNKILKTLSSKITISIDEVLKEIIKKYGINDLSKYLTTDEIIEKSYKINKLFNSIVSDNNIEISDIQRIIDDIVIEKNKIIESCPCHVLVCNKSSYYDHEYKKNNGHVKCTLCKCEYTCDSCCYTTGFYQRHTFSGNTEINKACDECKRMVAINICIKCQRSGCYCGCPKGCVCD